MTLATIYTKAACSAARRSASEIGLLLWDYMESSQSPTDLRPYEPIKGMYEDAVQALARSRHHQDHPTLGVLIKMEERGYVPSRHLARLFSMGLCSTVNRVGNAMYILKNSHTNEAARKTRVEMEGRWGGGGGRGGDDGGEGDDRVD